MATQGPSVDPVVTLKGIDFPRSREEIIEYAQQHGADPGMLRRLQFLPERQYHDMAEVLHEYGRIAA